MIVAIEAWKVARNLRLPLFHVPHLLPSAVLQVLAICISARSARRPVVADLPSFSPHLYLNSSERKRPSVQEFIAHSSRVEALQNRFSHDDRGAMFSVLTSVFWRHLRRSVATISCP